MTDAELRNVLRDDYYAFVKAAKELIEKNVSPDDRVKALKDNFPKYDDDTIRACDGSARNASVY